MLSIQQFQHHFWTCIPLLPNRQSSQELLILYQNIARRENPIEKYKGQKKKKKDSRNEKE